MPEPSDHDTGARREALQEAVSFPASSSQERLWHLHRLAPGSPAYNLPAAARLRGRLDRLALERSFNELLQRHHIFRTRFATAEGRLRQVLVPELELKLAVRDLRSVSPFEQENELQRAVAAEAERPFVLSRPPLLRVTLVLLDNAEQALILVLHHIVADCWSLGLVCQELAALYAAFAADEPSPLPPAWLQFSDYALWEREQEEDERWQKQLAYWRTQLDRVQPLPLAPDYPGPLRRAFAGACHGLELPAPLSRRLKDLCRRQQVTPFILFLSAFKVLLHGYTGQTDLAVGAPVVTRGREELESLIGCLVNLLLLRTHATSDPTFCEFLGRVRETVLSGTAHQDVPFERVLQALGLGSAQPPSPLLANLLTFEPGPFQLRLPGLECEPLPVSTATAKFDLLIEWWETAQGFSGRIEYSTDLFTPARIARLAIHYRLLLETVAANPHLRLSELADLIPGESPVMSRK